VTVTVDALPGRTYDGKVAAVYPAASATSRVFGLRVNVDDPHFDLRPGMYARGTVTTQLHHNVVVPITALVPVPSGLANIAGEGTYGTATGQTTLPPQQVFIAGPDGKAQAVPVQLGIVTPTQAEVVSGLQPGQAIVVNGQGLLQPGTPVRVMNQAGGPERKRRMARGY
jgi:multidrug efflux pump subunit AcrA (membrane-fusion protein)